MKLKRLLELVERRKQWQDEIAQVKRMQSWVLGAEEILSGEYFRHNPVQPITEVSDKENELELSNEQVGQRFDEWCEELRHLQTDPALSIVEQQSLNHFLAITSNLRPHLIQCYTLAGMPRTNNEMEGYIRSLKTRYRRVSGRKNWGSYLLRYGRSVAYYEYLSRAGMAEVEMSGLIGGVELQLWRRIRQSDRAEQQDQLKRFRFKRDSQKFLGKLESRWENRLIGTTLLH